MFCNLKLKIGKNRCSCRFQLGQLNNHQFGKELFIWLNVHVFRGRWSNFVCVLLSLFGIEGGMWDVIVLIPDPCLSIS